MSDEKKIDALTAERDDANAAMHAALRLVTDLRWALGDDGGRMQSELIAFAKQTLKDAERYRYLREDFSPSGLNIDGNHAWVYRRNATLKGPSLDAAIDAAM